VPACAACNQGFDKDDDCARLIFISAEGAIGNPARGELKAKVHRFADRSESKRALESLYASLGAAYLPNESGVFLKKQTFVAEGERLDAFAVRVTKAVSIARNDTGCRTDMSLPRFTIADWRRRGVLSDGMPSSFHLSSTS
jgi:hypothetical protein